MRPGDDGFEESEAECARVHSCVCQGGVEESEAEDAEGFADVQEEEAGEGCLGVFLRGEDPCNDRDLDVARDVGGRDVARGEHFPEERVGDVEEELVPDVILPRAGCLGWGGCGEPPGVHVAERRDVVAQAFGKDVDECFPRAVGAADGDDLVKVEGGEVHVEDAARDDACFPEACVELDKVVHEDGGERLEARIEEVGLEGD